MEVIGVGACQIGSGAFGEWFWWFYTVVSSMLLVSRPLLNGINADPHIRRLQIVDIRVIPTVARAIFTGSPD